MGEEQSGEMGEITVPVPKHYGKIAEELDNNLQQDVYMELGKSLMDVLNDTAKQEVDARK